MNSIRTKILGAAILGALTAGTLACSSPASAQQVFATPEAAATALVDAAKNPGQGQLEQIFGPGGKALLSSGDPDVDKQRLQDFLGLAENGSAVADGPDGEKRLVFGSGGWQFPVPLKKDASGWVFDVKAGEQTVTDRAVGENELTAIAACADYVEAQNEYFASLHDDEPVQQFAQKLISTPGRHDGLYWDPESPTDHSPLSDQVAEARQAGSGSYHGYVYRILTRQGASAPGGAYDYMVNGRLLAGFALVAYPEKWGETGVMTFLCDQRGQVYQRNYGPDTTAAASTIRIFAPGGSWQPVTD